MANTLPTGTVSTRYFRMRKRFGHIVEFHLDYNGYYNEFYEHCASLQAWAYDYCSENSEVAQRRTVRRDKHSQKYNVAQIGFLTEADAMLARLQWG